MENILLTFFFVGLGKWETPLYRPSPFASYARCVYLVRVSLF
jgi:hypothetical protein